jgi:hypothetical protein
VPELPLGQVDEAADVREPLVTIDHEDRQQVADPGPEQHASPALGRARAVHRGPAIVGRRRCAADEPSRPRPVERRPRVDPRVALGMGLLTDERDVVTT